MTDTAPTRTLFVPAAKEKLHARVAIDGPTGAGKTWTMLVWARILAGPTGKIGVIDTENRSAAYYAPDPRKPIPPRMNFWDPPFEFGHMAWGPPYDPVALARTIETAEKEVGEDGVVCVDSFTHFWNGEGGTLDVVDNAAAKVHGNTFAGWKVGTPVQRNLLDVIVHARCHVIVTMRSKMEWVIETNEKGKQVPRKIGMAPEQRAGIEYEFTVVADMDLDHRMAFTKTRCSDLDGAVIAPGRAHEPAKLFADWLGSGVERITTDEADALIARMNAIEESDRRAAIKTEFADRFGRPRDLLTDTLSTALDWLNGALGAAPTHEAPVVAGGDCLPPLDPEP